MTDLKDILHQDEEMNQEELLRYLEGNATPEERFAIEKQMADSDFLNDAVEGLQDFQDKKKLQQYAAQLNIQLRKQTAKEKKRKLKRGIKDQNWVLISIVTILLLCILGYQVIRMFYANR